MGKTVDFGFYGILTNPKIGYEALAKVMVEHHVKFIQLRIKNHPRDEVLNMARRVRDIVSGDSLFIVNDDPEIARDVGADGVHLGQEDISPSNAREMLGKDAIIGLSTHNPVQTRIACEFAPNYIGVGPVYATPTKKMPDPVIGLKGMRAMLDEATVPAVAIGGIDLNNVDAVVNSGARNLCAVRCINNADNPAAVLQEMIQKIESAGR